MRLVILSKMFNERDFADVFLRHYFEHGCDEVAVIDHGSSDGSAELVSRRRCCRVIESAGIDTTRLTYGIDGMLCNRLFDYARHNTAQRTWWLFPDVDELLRPPPGSHHRLREYLEQLTDIDGIGCVGVHCLPLGQRDREIESASSEALLSRLDDLLPARGFERPPRQGEAWKNIAWQFWENSPKQFRGLKFSVGSHVLIGPHKLRMHHECLAAYHYKVRSLRAFCDRTRALLDRIPPDDVFARVIGEKLSIVQGWQRSSGRLLRLGQRLSVAQIREAAKCTLGQGVYLSTPFPEFAQITDNQGSTG